MLHEDHGILEGCDLKHADLEEEGLCAVGDDAVTNGSSVNGLNMEGVLHSLCRDVELVQSLLVQTLSQQALPKQIHNLSVVILLVMRVTGDTTYENDSPLESR